MCPGAAQPPVFPPTRPSCVIHKAGAMLGSCPFPVETSQERSFLSSVTVGVGQRPPARKSSLGPLAFTVREGPDVRVG